MARICLTCSNTGVGTISRSDGSEHKFVCLQCAPVQERTVGGITVASASSLRDTPRYTLRRQMGDRWLDVLHTGAEQALSIKVDELRAKGTANWMLQIIDNWS